MVNFFLNFLYMLASALKSFFKWGRKKVKKNFGKYFFRRNYESDTAEIGFIDKKNNMLWSSIENPQWADKNKQYTILKLKKAL